MRWIVSTSLKYRYLVVYLAVMLLVYGIARINNASVDVFPEFAPPRVEVQTLALGLTAAEVEELITVPLEQALNGVLGLDVMFSKSVPDLSSIDLRFKPGTDLIFARQVVQERISTVLPTLPTWAAPPVLIQPLSSTSRVMKIGLSSEEMPLTDLSMIAYWKIRARLLGVPGVANVPIWGERIKIPMVQVDSTRMRAHDVSLNEVMEVTADSGRRATYVFRGIRHRHWRIRRNSQPKTHGPSSDARPGAGRTGPGAHLWKTEERWHAAAPE